MHFKKYFYRDYFSPPLNLRKQLTPNEADTNARLIRQRNDLLKNAVLPTQALDLLSHPVTIHNAITELRVTTTYPGLIIGSGYTHEIQAEGEFKLGFYFDHTTGLPCIPGSSVKGVLRSFFPQFAKKEALTSPQENDPKKLQKAAFIAAQLGWQQHPQKLLIIHQLELAIFEGIDILQTKPGATAYKNIYQRCCFYNAFISSSAAGNKIFEIDTITPHTKGPLKNPTPLNFLKIRPGVTFTIPMQLQNINLSETETVSKTQLKDLFEKIIHLNGLGAKTNVGYGQFQ